MILSYHVDTVIRNHRWLWIGGLCGFLTTSALGASLTPYLFRPGELTPECQSIQGFFPVDPKINLLFDNQTYRSVLPPMIDRHAQSFQCGSQKGTVYYFLYQKPDEAERAVLFSQGIVSHLTPAPVIKKYPNGFALLSFKKIPPVLMESLDRKLKGPNPVASIIHSTQPASITRSSVPSSIVSESTHPQQAAVAGSFVQDDISKEMLVTLLHELDCEGIDLSNEVRETCDMLLDFKKGSEIDLAIPESSARIGLTYNISSFGQLNGRSYTALIGSGRSREMAQVPLFTTDGVEDLEIQALLAARRQGQALPPGNEMTARLLKQPRPDRPSLIATKGISWILPISSDRKGYLRRAGSRWILIILTGDNPAQQARSDVSVAALY